MKDLIKRPKSLYGKERSDNLIDAIGIIISFIVIALTFVFALFGIGYEHY